MTRNWGIHHGSAFTAVLLSWLLLLVPLSLVARDQTPEQTSGEAVLADAMVADVGERGAEVLDRLETNLTVVRRYQGKMTVASAEDSLVLRLQVAQGQDRFMEALGDLADIVRPHFRCAVRPERPSGSFRFVGELRRRSKQQRDRRYPGGRGPQCNRPGLDAHLFRR